jgi:hypothetical protein
MAAATGGGCNHGGGSAATGSHDAAAWYVDDHATGRVGTVKREQFLTAYYSSEMVGEDLRRLKQEHAEATAAGDQASAARLQARGEAMQATAHRQMWERETLAPIVDRLRDKLPQVARAAQVDQILEEGAPIPDGAVAVDITDRVVALLPLRADLKDRQKPSGR